MKFSTFCTKCKKTQYSRFLGWLTVWVKRRMFCFSTWENTLTAFVWQRSEIREKRSKWMQMQVHIPRWSTCRSAWKLETTLFGFFCQTNAVSVFSQVEKQNMRLFTQTVSQPRNREYCVFLHFVQKVLNFILLAMMFCLTIMDFKIFWVKVW